MIGVILVNICSLIFAIYIVCNDFIKYGVTSKLFFNLSFSIYYFVIPLLTYIIYLLDMKILIGYSKIAMTFSVEEHFKNSLIFLLCFLTYNLFYIFFNTFRQKSSMKPTDEKKYLKLYILGIVITLIGFLSELVIIKSFGGVVNALKMADKLRAYGIDRALYMPRNLLFVNVLSSITLVSPFIFFILKKRDNNMKNTFLFVFSLLLSIFYLMFFAGRMPIVLFFVCFVLDFIFNNTKRPWMNTIVFLFLSILMLTKLDDLFFYLSYGYVKENTSNSISNFVNDFSFPFSNSLSVFNMNQLYGYRYGIDFFTWIINIIPSRILKIFGLGKVQSGFQFISSYYNPTGDALGGTPTDMITLGMRQLGYVGLLITTSIYTVVSFYIDKVIFSIKNKKYLFLKIRLAMIMFIVVPYADFDSFFRNRFDMIIVLIISYFFFGNNSKLLKWMEH